MGNRAARNDVNAYMTKLAVGGTKNTAITALERFGGKTYANQHVPGHERLNERNWNTSQGSLVFIVHINL